MVPTLLLLVSLAALPGAAWSQTGQESLSAVPTEASKAHIGPAASSLAVALQRYLTAYADPSVRGPGPRLRAEGPWSVGQVSVG